MSSRIKPKLNKIPYILIVIGILVFLYPFFTTVYAQYEQSKLVLENPVLDNYEPNASAPVDVPESEENDPSDNSSEPSVEPSEEPVQPKPAVVEPKPVTALMRLEIPAIKISVMVLKGTSQEVLAKGAGWYEQSVLPGLGNTAIGAHNNMYGSWFRNVHKLKPGDELIITYQNQKYVYIVDWVRPIAPDDWSVIAPTDRTALTLTTCHTKTHRLAARAWLKE